ncbi:hypothetical protein VTO73DRAFT_6756 [Trametes versicolor]
MSPRVIMATHRKTLTYAVTQQAATGNYNSTAALSLPGCGRKSRTRFTGTLGVWLTPGHGAMHVAASPDTTRQTSVPWS